MKSMVNLRSTGIYKNRLVNKMSQVNLLPPSKKMLSNLATKPNLKLKRRKNLLLILSKRARRFHQTA